jgi:4-hydroxy-tetrahydrodipicolinate reductase
VTEIVVSGALGRLGQRIIVLALEAQGIRVAGAIVRAGSASEGKEIAPGVRASGRAEDLLQRGRVLIETAPRAVAVAHAEIAAKAGAPMLIATTGFDKGELARIESGRDRSAILIASNLSAGIAVLTDLVRRASAALEGYHLEIAEMHHAKKKDAPSGTAWSLARAAAEARGQDIERDAICARAGEIGPRGDKEIGLSAIRGGDVIGDHTVYLIGPSERVELTHRAQSRDVFAHGALRAAKFLGDPSRSPGLYTMRDALNLG